MTQGSSKTNKFNGGKSEIQHPLTILNLTQMIINYRLLLMLIITYYYLSRVICRILVKIFPRMQRVEERVASNGEKLKAKRQSYPSIETYLIGGTFVEGKNVSGR